jgi:predicted RNA-binding protein associated with RNAse of E/G family
MSSSEVGGAARWKPVTVLSTKWNGDFHRRTPSLELGTDDAGTWLWMPPGTVADTPSGRYNAIPGLRLIPVDQMWSAYFVPSSPVRAQPQSVYVDITTPNRRIDDVFKFVDLDLDLEQKGTGPVQVLDRDEFENHAQQWSYPTELISSAEQTCAAVAAALANSLAPFNGAYVTWWQLVV